MSKISVSVETVTPEMASKYLANQSNIRPLKRQNVDRWVKQLREGKWAVNGESIKFNRQGRLFDGQHRLTACVVTGLPITSVIVRNADEVGVDEGTARTVAQLIAGQGEKNYIQHASLSRAIFYLESGLDPWLRTEKISNFVLMGFRETMNQVLAERAVNIGVKCRILPASSASAFFYMASKKHSSEALEDFILNVENGERLSSGSPRMELRRWAEGRRRAGRVGRDLYRMSYIAIARTWAFDSGGREGDSFYKTAIWSKINEAEIPSF